MTRLILIFFLLLTATTGYAEPFNTELQLLDWSKAVRFWIDKLQPKYSPTETTLIANQVLFHAEQHDIPVDLLVALITAESKFDTKAHSTHGAQGLTQVIPKYHREKVRGRSLYDPSVGIEVGTLVLKDCLTKHRGNKFSALACYSGSRGSHAKRYQTLVLTQLLRFKQTIAHTNPDPVILMTDVDSTIF